MCEACFASLQYDIYNHKFHKFEAAEDKNKFSTCDIFKIFWPIS